MTESKRNLVLLTALCFFLLSHVRCHVNIQTLQTEYRLVSQPEWFHVCDNINITDLTISESNFIVSSLEVSEAVYEFHPPSSSDDGFNYMNNSGYSVASSSVIQVVASFLWTNLDSAGHSGTGEISFITESLEFYRIVSVDSSSGKNRPKLQGSTSLVLEVLQFELYGGNSDDVRAFSDSGALEDTTSQLEKELISQINDYLSGYYERLDELYQNPVVLVSQQSEYSQQIETDFGIGQISFFPEFDQILTQTGVVVNGSVPRDISLSPIPTFSALPSFNVDLAESQQMISDVLIYNVLLNAINSGVFSANFSRASWPLPYFDYKVGDLMLFFTNLTGSHSPSEDITVGCQINGKTAAWSLDSTSNGLTMDLPYGCTFFDSSNNGLETITFQLAVSTQFALRRGDWANGFRIHYLENVIQKTQISGDVQLPGVSLSPLYQSVVNKLVSQATQGLIGLKTFGSNYSLVDMVSPYVRVFDEYVLILSNQFPSN